MTSRLADVCISGRRLWACSRSVGSRSWTVNITSRDSHRRIGIAVTSNRSLNLLFSTLQPFDGLFSRTTWVSRYQIGKTNLDFTRARDSEWLWHQLGHMQVCTLLQTDNHASTPPLSFLQAGCPSCRPTNSVKALKAQYVVINFCWCNDSD